VIHPQVKSSEMKVSGLEREGDRLQKEVDLWKENAKTKGTKVKSMKQERRELLQEKSSIESENRDLTKKIKRLETELQRVKDIHDKEDTSRKEFISKITKLEREKQELEKHVKRSGDNLTQMQEKNQHNDLMLQQLTVEKKDFERLVEVTQSANATLEATVSSLEAQLGNLKATILEHEECLQRLQNEFDTLRFHCDEVETEVKEKTEIIEKQRNEMQNLQSSNEQAKQDLQKGCEEKEELMSSLQQSNSLMETLGLDRDEMQKKLIEQETKEENIIDALARKKEDIQHLEAKLAELGESTTEESFKLREKLDSVTVEVEALKSEKEEVVSCLKEEIGVLQKQKDEQQEKIAVQESIQAEVETLLEDMNEMSEKNSELIAERDILLQANAELQEELEVKKTKVTQFLKEKEDLLAAESEMQEDLNRGESRIDDFEHGIASLQTQLVSTEETLSRLRDEKDRIVLDHERVEQDLRNLKSKSHDSDSSNSVLRKEIDVLKSDNEELIQMLNDLKKRRAKRSFGCDADCLAEKEQLKKELAGKEVEIGELVDDVGMLRGENDELRRKMFEKRGSSSGYSLEGRTAGKENAVKRR
jgi:DNA repair exonuclease SbcCD ATPase subunit